MPCSNINPITGCEGVSIQLDCLSEIAQGDSKMITLTLVKDEYAVDLDLVKDIQLVLSDVRGFRIARYRNHLGSLSDNTSDTPSYLPSYQEPIEDDFDFNANVWFDNLLLNMNQLDLSGSYNPSSFLNKGQISFEISSKVSNSLLAGWVYSNWRIEFLDGNVYYVRCFKIGTIVINKFI